MIVLEKSGASTTGGIAFGSIMTCHMGTMYYYSTYSNTVLILVQDLVVDAVSGKGGEFAFIGSMESLTVRQKGRICCCIVGFSGAGKTFAGDYLERFHNVAHVNGDFVMHSRDERLKRLTTNLRTAFNDFWFDSRPAPAELWQPYFDEMISRVREFQKEHEQVCLTFAAYHAETRSYLRMHLPEMIFIVLDMDIDALIDRHSKRFEKYADAQGQSVADAFEKITKIPYSRAAYVNHTKSMLRGLDIPDNIPNDSYSLRFGKEGVDLCQLCSILGLSDSHTKLSEEEKDEIAQINYKRFETFEID